MNKKIFRILFVAVAAIFCLTFTVSAEDGVSDTEIHIGQWSPQTGGAALWGSPARGAHAYYEMINAKGGIHGRKIIHHYFDDGYNPAKTKAGVKQLQESDHGIFAWVGGIGSPPGLAVRDYLMERKIPMIGPMTGSFAWVDPPQKYLFGLYPLYIIEAKALVKYAVETMGKKRIAIVYNNDEYGKNGFKGAEVQMAKHNMKLVAAIPKNQGDKDLKPHVAKLMQFKPDAVLLWVDPVSAITIVGTAKAMRFSSQFMATSTLSDYPLLYKLSRGSWAGVITSSFGALPDSDHPTMKMYKKEVFAKYAAKKERWGTFFTAGISFQEPFVEALKRVGRNLTRERLIEELENMKNFQGTLGKISYKPFDKNDIYSRQGSTSIFLTQCLKDGKTKVLTDWFAPEYNPGKE